MNYKLIKLAPEFESDDLSSHVFGCPDVPVLWNNEENPVFNNDEVFFLQINLKDVNSNLLPKEGILMFTICTMSHPYRGIVRYFKESEQTERIDFNEDFEQFDLSLEYEINKDENSNDIKILDSMPKFINYHPMKSEVCLLSINKNIFKETKLFEDYEEETIAFVIKEEELKNLNFDKCNLAISLD